MTGIEPTLEQMIKELMIAGWRQHRGSMTVWICPQGKWWRGPYGAWKAMKAISRLV